jgi:hypothetical protein
MNIRRLLLGAGLALLVIVPSSAVGRGQEAGEQKNMVLISHTDLNGHGDGGEGMAIQQWPDGRRVLYFAHGGGQTCLSIVDVTHPERPALINQLPSPRPGVTRCGSLGLSGNVLAVANQAKTGQKPAGMWVLDVSDLKRIQKARSIQDLALSFFDTSGPQSRGVHDLWFVDGEFAHLTTGARDSDLTNPADDMFYMVVDLRDRRHPREVGRWWLPGTQKNDPCLPGCSPERQRPVDHGYRAHSVRVFPDRSDRAYMAYRDGGQIILDISGLEGIRAGRANSFSPRLVSRLKFSPPFPGNTHTVQPLFSRGLAVDIEETSKEKCADAPHFVWLVDIRAEINPVVLGTAPFPENVAELCKRGGRSGPQNLAPDFPGPTSAHLKNTFVAAFDNAGVRIYRLVDQPVPFPNTPPGIEEIGYFIPVAPPGNVTGSIQISYTIVDEHGLIYASDSRTGGLYILKYNGRNPLD